MTPSFPHLRTVAPVTPLARYSEQYGAREINRIINREVESGLARLLIGGEIEAWNSVVVKVEDGGLVFTQSQITT